MRRRNKSRAAVLLGVLMLLPLCAQAQGVLPNSGLPASALAAAIFGNGSDGTVVISSGTTNLARDMQYANLTISGTGHLNSQGGFEIRVSGTLDLTACPAGGIFTALTNSPVFNPTAGAAAGATGGTGGDVFAGRTSIPGSNPNVAGKSAGSGAGTAGTQSAGMQQFALGGRGGAAGAGGTSGANTGGALAAQVAAATFGTANMNKINPDFDFFLSPGTPATIQIAGAGAAGGSGGGDGVNNGGGSGASGAGGGPLRIWAQTLSRGASTAASCIAVLGEKAGASGAAAGGTASGGGGSGGGGGGWILLVTGQKIGISATGALDVSGGAGAAGGNGLSTGNGGDGGQGGNCGAIDAIDLATNTYSHPVVADAAGTAGGTHSTITGGTSGPGCVGVGNL